MPDYPVYIPSKGRHDRCLTADALHDDDVAVHLVVEEHEADAYRDNYPYAEVHVLPFSDRGTVVPARNWIKEHATEAGHARHWQLDDNIRGAFRRYNNTRVPCHFGYALEKCEAFTDRYTNVAISGLNYSMFAPADAKMPPFYVNQRVYSCSLINNELDYEFRGTYNEDADYCLQVIGDGYCTLLLNAFVVKKIKTMKMGGGNTDELYGGDGRAKMSRELERRWPHVVETTKRFGRAQHRVKDEWRKFDTELELRDDLDLDSLPPIIEDAELAVDGNPRGEDMETVHAEYQESRRQLAAQAESESADGTEAGTESESETEASIENE